MSAEGWTLEASELVAVMVRMRCDCGGELRATGEATATSPPKHRHLCTGCGKLVAIPGTRYPAIQYRAEGEAALIG